MNNPAAGLLRCNARVPSSLPLDGPAHRPRRPHWRFFMPSTWSATGAPRSWASSVMRWYRPPMTAAVSCCAAPCACSYSVQASPPTRASSCATFCAALARAARQPMSCSPEPLTVSSMAATHRLPLRCKDRSPRCAMSTADGAPSRTTSATPPAALERLLRCMPHMHTHHIHHRLHAVCVC